MNDENCPGGWAIVGSGFDRGSGAIGAPSSVRSADSLTLLRRWGPASVVRLAIAAMAALVALEMSDDEVGHLPALALAIAGWCTAAGFGLLAHQRTKAAQAARAESDAQSRRSLAAETANAAKSRYLANVSHEIRSPLNAIYGYAQLIERSQHNDAREAARVIKRSAEHLTNLVEGLLDISLLENGMMRIKSDQVNLREFIDQTCWMMRPDALSKDLDFRVDLSGRLPELVRMDQSRLRQVLINLLSNAIKFTDRGSVTLKVRYSSQIAVFEILDTGPGISATDRERIFVPFERGEAEDQLRRPGVGLGLPITRAIVEILGGQLELESEPGTGTCFRVTLMLGEVAGTIAGAALRKPAAYTAMHALDGRGRSILLVDDDPQQLSFMKALLASQGFAVTAVSDGEAAVSLCCRASFDLAVLDINLPGISGWETGLRIRELLGEEVSILMLSGNVHEGPSASADKPLHDGFLAKPVEFTSLLEAVGGLLDIPRRPMPAHGKVESGQIEKTDPRALPHIARVREFLSIGHYRGVEGALGELAEDVPEAADLVAFLLEKLDRFDLAAMSRKLEAY